MKLDLRFAAWLVACLTALSVLTACGGAPERPAQAPGGAAPEVAGAPAPQDVPKQPPTQKRDLVKTASMTIKGGQPR